MNPFQNLNPKMDYKNLKEGFRNAPIIITTFLSVYFEENLLKKENTTNSFLFLISMDHPLNCF